ncbi:hypothetical protein [Kutzneria kofuensis]|uniref:Uncharacterized protein n=1 Tax=Kutzneria kofuensis TaxID=103725 RepID=A0A7W9KEE0_9PSEU|nr:hypothetical protein [Kutzneria kofuensis]MBB5891016.1 hypothetical protein [Kutzneria kofuensis]
MTRSETSFGDRITDSERDFLAEVRKDWYFMGGSRLLLLNEDCRTAEVAPVYRTFLATLLLRKGLVEKDKPYQLLKVDGSTVLGAPLVLTYEGVIALDFASAQQDEEN